VLSLQEIAEMLGAADSTDAPRGPSEAESLVQALLLLDPAAGNRVDIQALNDREFALSAARRLLQLAIDDPDTSAVAEEVLEEPPTDEQMSIEAVMVGVVVLAALISWLQTKVDIRITRVDGKVNFDFRVTKKAASDATIQHIAGSVRNVLSVADQGLS
jgi:hypothetical protein